METSTRPSDGRCLILLTLAQGLARAWDPWRRRRGQPV